MFFGKNAIQLVRISSSGASLQFGSLAAKRRRPSRGLHLSKVKPF